MADLLKTIMDADHGGSASEANRKFAEMLDAVYATRKKGVLKFALEVAPSKFSKDNGSVIGVDVRIKVDINKPEFDNPSSMFFVLADGSLSRRHPDQIEMDMYVEETQNGQR